MAPVEARRALVAVAICHAALAFSPARLHTNMALPAGRAGRLPFSTRVAGKWASTCLRQDLARHNTRGMKMTVSKKEDVPMAPDIRSLESTTPPLPHRTVTMAGYKASDSDRTWPSFVYSSAGERRSKVAEFARRVLEQSIAEQEAAGLSLSDSSISLPPSLPPLRVVLIGGPCSGKGTIGPMLSQAFCTRIVSVGQLLRGEVRSGTPRGLQVRDVMSNGELLQDSLVLDLVRSRITDSWDVQQNGWELVGFPRTPEQARAIASDVSESGLKPDCVIVLDRPDELCKEFALGRMTDSATGKIFHPEYAPPPAEIAASGRLVWRSDDNTEVIEKRIRAYKQNLGGIMGEFEKAGVPVKTFDNARSDLETFAEIAAYVEDIGRKNLETEGGWRAVFRKRFGSDTENAGIEQDVDPLCDLSVVTATDCVDSWNAAQSPYLEAVRRCNTYASRDFLPVIIDDYQVGWSSRSFVEQLTPHLVQGRAVELVQLQDDRAAPVDLSSGTKLDIKGYGVALRLCPSQSSLEERTATMAALVKELVDEGSIPEKAIRRELQDVRPISVGFLGGEAGRAQPPLLQLERGAMIHFGVPSYGIHVNGYVADPVTRRPQAIWVAKRSMSKATYPGMLDQVVAGGQPAGLCFMENCEKECEEEASLPPDVIASVSSTGLLSYKYKTRKGLSTKVLATFDLPMPPDLIPVCGDGEVEDFRLWTIEEALQSIRESLPLWKPNRQACLTD